MGELVMMVIVITSSPHTAKAGVDIEVHETLRHKCEAVQRNAHSLSKAQEVEVQCISWGTND